MEYNINDLLPVTDDKNCKFLDYELKTAHPIITDYSRIDREIIVKDHHNSRTAQWLKLNLRIIFMKNWLKNQKEFFDGIPIGMGIGFVIIFIIYLLTFI